jgi:DNA-binding transcriptional LysR family regulator
MNETDLSWDDLRLFLAVARHRGLAGASTETQKSAPTLGRRMLSLERQLGTDLFDRSARGYTLTPHGNTMLEQVLQIENSVQPILQDAQLLPPPRVKVSAGTWVTHHLCRHLPAPLENGDLNIQFISTNQVLDITHREAVIGIRNAEPDHPHLVRQPLKHIRFAVYATQEDLSVWAQVTASTPSAKWVREQAANDVRIEVSDPRNAMDLALTGIAKVVLPTFIGDAQPTLIRVSDPIAALDHQQWLVTHQEDRNRPEVRHVVNWLKSVLGDDNTLR